MLKSCLFSNRMMSEPNPMSQPAEPFEYMLYEGDPDHLKTIVSSPRQKSPRIDPDVLKLTHRIGRGPFGDLWVATHHLFREDYNEYHEVAVKMLHSMKEDQIPAFLARFDELFFKCQGLRGVCLLQGISKKMGKARSSSLSLKPSREREREKLILVYSLFNLICRCASP